MRRLVREGAEDPLVSRRAKEVASSSPHIHPADAVFRYVQSMPYRQDADLATARGFDGDEYSEVIQGAPFQVEKEMAHGARSVEGDCDCRSVLFQSMVESMGYPTRMVLVRGPSRDTYSHVYSEVQTERGWQVSDTIMDGNGGRPRFRFGDEVGAPDARDKRTFDVRGNGLIGLLLLGALAWGLTQ